LNAPPLNRRHWKVSRNDFECIKSVGLQQMRLIKMWQGVGRLKSSPCLPKVGVELWLSAAVVVDCLTVELGPRIPGSRILMTGGHLALGEPLGKKSKCLQVFAQAFRAIC